MIGIIKSYSPEHGYGFIQNENGHDYWFHASEWMSRKYKYPLPYLTVVFTPVKGKKGYKAIKVKETT